MSRQSSSSSSVPPEDALAALIEWCDSGTQRVAELTGPSDSGRTGILLRLHEAVSDAVLLDASGSTCEDLVERVLAAAGLDTPPERRADWGYALRNSPFSGSLVIIVNTHRAGRTRRSAEAERMAQQFAGELAVAGRVKVVIERDLFDVAAAQNRFVVNLQSPADGASRQLADGPATDALRALALAEVRRAPLAVWTELTRALESHTGRPADVAAALDSAGDLLEVDADSWVRFRDERMAESLRRTTAADVVRAVNLHFVEWLQNEPWTGARGQYLTYGLAMHAVQAGEFDSVQRSGRLVARGGGGWESPAGGRRASGRTRG
ncbi:hypothetical protein [Streptomyces chryseus]